MTKYRVIFDDPDNLDLPSQILVPSPNWLRKAMSGNLPPIWVYWQLQDDEKCAVEQGTHETYKHDPQKHALQWTAPRIGPLTEEEAMEYLCLKDLPRRCWAEKHNRPMFKIVLADQVPTDRRLRNAWEIRI